MIKLKKKSYTKVKQKFYIPVQTSNLIQYFKDDATANNAEKHSIIMSKGIINNFISEYLMKSLEIQYINTF